MSFIAKAVLSFVAMRKMAAKATNALAKSYHSIFNYITTLQQLNETDDLNSSHRPQQSQTVDELSGVWCYERRDYRMETSQFVIYVDIC